VICTSVGCDGERFRVLSQEVNRTEEEYADRRLILGDARGISAEVAAERFHDLPPTLVAGNQYISKEVKQSRYTPWRRLGGEEV
jgi:hypothetical protein